MHNLRCLYKTYRLHIVFVLLVFMLQQEIHAQLPARGLDLWMRADSGLQLYNKRVLIWNDLSGHQRQAITQTRNGPEFIHDALNGHPVVRFNGTNTGMETPSFATFPGSRGTIIIVARINGRSMTSGVGMGNLLATYHGEGLSWQFGSDGEIISFYDGLSGHGFPIHPSEQNPWQILTLERTGDTVMKIYQGGRLDKTFNIVKGDPAVNTLKIGFNGRTGGTATDSIPEVLNGDIAEIIIYDRVLDQQETTAVYDYLTGRYGLRLRPPPFWERTWFYAAVVIVLLLLAVLLTKIVVQRKLRKKLAEMERQREMDRERHRISREMHDDIGAGLAQIAMMSESARKKSGNDNEKELLDIAQTSRTLVNNMSEIIWSLNPEYKTLEHLISYLREQLNKQLEYAGMEFSIRLPEGGSDILLTNEQRRNILLITKEIVNNAVKYSGARHLTVEALLEAGFLRFWITDDGCGFDVQQQRTGNGLHNIRQRATELGGTLELITAPGNGTKYRYAIPLPPTT